MYGYTGFWQVYHRQTHIYLNCARSTFILLHWSLTHKKNYRFISFSKCSVFGTPFSVSYAVVVGCECRSPSQLRLSGLLYIQVVLMFLEVARKRRKLFLARAFIRNSSLTFCVKCHMCCPSVNAVKLLKVSLGRCTSLCRIFMLPF